MLELQRHNTPVGPREGLCTGTSGENETYHSCQKETQKSRFTPRRSTIDRILHGSHQGRRQGELWERPLPPLEIYQLIICINYCSSINSLFILSRLQSSFVATGDKGPQPQPGPPDSCHTEIMRSFKMQQNRWFSWGLASDPTAGAFTIISRNLSLHYIV